jgi:hypothetical protein
MGLNDLTPRLVTDPNGLFGRASNIGHQHGEQDSITLSWSIGLEGKSTDLIDNWIRVTDPWKVILAVERSDFPVIKAVTVYVAGEVVSIANLTPGAVLGGRPGAPGGGLAPAPMHLRS